MKTYNSIGFGDCPGSVNADAQVGAVTVGGCWIASSLAAGVQDDGLSFGAISNLRVRDVAL